MQKKRTYIVTILTNIFDLLLSFGATLAAAVVIFITIGISTDVVLRYIFNKPTPWMKEVVEFSILWLTFLSTAWALKKGAHVKMELVLNLLKPKYVQLLNTITSFTGAVVCGILVWYSSASTWKYFVTEHRIATDRRFILWPVVIIIPIGCLLMLIQFIRNAASHYGRLRKGDYQE